VPLEISSENWKDASPLQLSALGMILSALQVMHFGVVDSVKASHFITNDGMIGAQIPPDQWVIEIERMEAVVWASLQVSVADYAVGPSIRSPFIAEYVINATSEGEKELCRSVKVRKAGGFV
jgi:hypothetical protein